MTKARLSEPEKRKCRCCIISSLKYGLKRPADDVKVDLENLILAAIHDGYRTFITGITCQTDVWAANIVMRLKDRFSDLRLIILSAQAPDSEDEAGDEPVLHTADLVRDGTFAWAIDHVSRVIAVGNGRTGDAVRYARAQNVPVIFLYA